jgi:uncharacterized protein (TIGR00369 family)
MDTRTQSTAQAAASTPSPALQAWLDEELAVQARLDAGPGAGVARPDQVAGRSGLELMQAMLRGELPYPPIARTLDFMLISVGEGSAVFQGRPGPAHLNPMGGVHGGWFATLLDSALGCAVHTCMPAGRGYTTAELSLNLVKGLTPRVARVRAEGRVLHCGRQLATAEARLVGADGTLYAHATTTCLVFEMPASR